MMINKCEEKGAFLMVFFRKVLLLGCGLIFMVSGPVWGAVAAERFTLKSEAALLMEPTTGEILFQKNPDQKMHPASVTKLMVMLLTLEALNRNQIKLTDVVTASPEACKMGGSQIWLEPGEQMTVSELLKAVCVVSANDASYALGEHLAGSEENFIVMMNRRAKELKMKNTVYVNTTGLEPSGGGSGNLTSVADQAILAREVIKYPIVFQWSGVWIDSLRGGKSFLRNTNKLVRFYRGCDGLKTGFTGEAGYCLVATAKRDGVRLIAVAMKAPTINDRSREISQLFNYGFSKFQAQTVYRSDQTVGKIRVFRGEEKYVAVKVAKELAAIIGRGATGKIHKTVRMCESLQAPVPAGQKVGEVTLTFDGKICGRVDLIAVKEVKRATIIQLWRQIFNNIIGSGVNRSTA
jgi:D-alanyl-D-alanine carboxypeptidase (penicillin-binding protein 5/6)